MLFRSSDPIDLWPAWRAIDCPTLLVRGAESDILSATIYAKVESFNPGGSVKDRICLNMINEAERDGQLKPGGTIVEPTSGNTGIGLALVSAVRGYKLILVMPESMSMERASLLSSYGAQLVLTAAWEGMKGSIKEAEGIIAQNPSYFMPDQFSNPANPAMHRKTTAVEIWDALEGEIGRASCRERV